MKKIKLTQGKFAIVDDEDFEFVKRLDPVIFERKEDKYKNRTNGKILEVVLRTQKRGGGIFYVKNFMIKRDISVAGKYVIEHINKNNLDLRKENLIVIKRSESIHHNKKRKGCTSKYKGVCYMKKVRNKKRWVSSISKDGKVVFYKLFNTEKEAAIAYNEKAKEIYGDLAYQNKID